MESKPVAFLPMYNNSLVLQGVVGGIWFFTLYPNNHGTYSMVSVGSQLETTGFTVAYEKTLEDARIIAHQCLSRFINQIGECIN